MAFLEDMLTAVYNATGIHPTAFNTKKVSTLPAINYQIYRSSDNGATAQWRMEVRVIDTTYSSALGKEELVKDTLITVGDSTKFDCSIYINGGGSLEDEETGYPMLITYYDIIKRS